jgi:hypothetical protein
MLTTYSLFIHHETDGTRFEPYLGEGHDSAFARAQELIAADSGIHTVEVHFGGDHLFSVGRVQP